MKITNNLQYNNLSELEQEITKLLYKLDYLGDIDSEVYNGLEAYRNVIQSSRKEYDCYRFPQKKIKQQKN